MPNSILSDMEFEERLTQMGDNQIELIKFVARQQYQTQKLCPIHSKDIKALKNRSRRETGAVGGIGAIFGAIMAGVVDYFIRK